jgi:four helix bundle protein
VAEKIEHHRDLVVYQRAFETSMKIFESTKSFPKEERYSLVDQIRRSSRSVSANLAEAWWKRRYEAAFISKLCDSQGEAAETQVWLEYSVKCGYMQAEIGRELYEAYNSILGTLVGIANHPETWLLKRPPAKS